MKAGQCPLEWNLKESAQTMRIRSKYLPSYNRINSGFMNHCRYTTGLFNQKI